MTEEQRQELTRRIHEEMASLRTHIQAMDETIAPVAPDQAIGRLSRLDTMINQSINEQSLAQSRERLRKLEYALTRMDKDPEFGECLECGDPIPASRLLALPVTEYCVNCAE